MNTCGRLFAVEKVYAFFDEGEVSKGTPVRPLGRVVVVADLFVNPFTDHVQICPNPIAIGSPSEFLVIGTRTSDGIHPGLVVKRRVSYSYASEVTPASVIVYSAGTNGPLRQEVRLSGPPALLVEPLEQAPSPDAQPSPGSVEVTGFSPTFSLEQAVQDALAQANAKFPAPPRNPDVAIEIDVKDIFARSGGNIQPGLFVRVTAK